jgi:hypothetical protein
MLTYSEVIQLLTMLIELCGLSVQFMVMLIAFAGLIIQFRKSK